MEGKKHNLRKLHLFEKLMEEKLKSFEENSVKHMKKIIYFAFLLS